MFYPMESLKRGGRFYYCWVADAWPLRFAAVTHKQLWSQDIRQLCKDLHEVFVTESGYPSRRFSLRLSSRLMHGLIRLYQRKVTVLLDELCMIHAHVFRDTNNKLAFHEVVTRVRRPLVRRAQPLALPEPPENELQVEEIIQASGNVVRNILDITLKEATIPEFQLPPNDAFGEEHPEQAFQLFADRTIEQILVQPDLSAAQYSGLELAAERSRDQSADKSRLAVDAPQMERISEHEISAFRKSTGEELLAGFEKDIPEIPEILPPELPARPELEKQVPTPPAVEGAATAQAAPAPRAAPTVEVELELEELEAAQPPAKRNRGNKLLIDKRIKLSGEFLRARLEHPAVEMRCQDFKDDATGTEPPWHALARRPARAGAAHFTAMFQRHCGTGARRDSAAGRDLHEMVAKPRPILLPRCTLRREVQEPPRVHTEPVSVAEGSRVSVELVQADTLHPLELPTLPAQELHPPPARESLHESPSKRPRLYDYRSLSVPDQRQLQGRKEQKEVAVVVTQEPLVDKENIPPPEEQQPTRRNVSSLLLAAGLYEPGPQQQDVMESLENRAPMQISRQGGARGGSDSETPLGSLDRTKVSLGDSVLTTDSERFIRNHWGVEGTLMKILSALKARAGPLTVHALVARGPTVPGRTRFIAASCFISILKLITHGFIKIDKDPQTSEIIDISLGVKLEDIE